MWRQHLDQWRFLMVELLIWWALKIIPRQTPEARELAAFVMHSWISKAGGQFVSTNYPTSREQ